MIIDLVVGCRPNFVKASAIVEAAKQFPRIKIRLIHTGQHSDAMSDPFLFEFNLNPDHQFGHDYHLYRSGVRFGKMVADLAYLWEREKPDYVMVVGDTDSTLAAAIAAKKSGIKVVHVEAGLRCGDDDMQEEINRKAVDSIADIMYTTTEGARDNLIREGHPPWTIKTVGNVMADTLKRFLPRALEKYPNKRTGSYAMFTLHRAENVDNKTKMQEIIDAISEVSKTIPVIFPKHPRRHVSLYVGGISVVEPMSYLEFIATMARCNFIMTDSGGVQEESTILGIPCITIRENTERPETVHQGTNRIAGTDGGSILELAKDAELRRASTKVFPVPDLWEGKAAERLLKDLSERM